MKTNERIRKENMKNEEEARKEFEGQKEKLLGEEREKKATTKHRRTRTK